MDFIWLSLTGLALGLAVVIPGISAGTMAVVFNVYDRLIGIITPNIKKILAEWKFWLPLLVGIAAGMFFFSKLISFLYESYPVPTVWFFIGIIAGSIPLVYGKVCKPPSLLPSVPAAVCFLSALALMIVITVVKPVEGTALYTELTVTMFFVFFLAGVISAIAMVIPGISGSFFLLLIGLYRSYLHAISVLNIPILIPFALGTGFGIFTSAALVRFLLSKAPRETYGAITGLVAGSIFTLFPGGFGEGTLAVFSVISLLAGIAISFFFGRKKP